MLLDWGNVEMAKTNLAFTALFALFPIIHTTQNGFFYLVKSTTPTDRSVNHLKTATLRN